MEDEWAEISRRAKEMLQGALAGCTPDLSLAQIGRQIWIHLALNALQSVVLLDEWELAAIAMICQDMEGLGVLGTCRKYRVSLLLPLATVSIPVLN